MSWLSSAAKTVYGDEDLAGLSRADLVEEFDEVLRRGWMVAADAVVLAAWRESYFGDRGTFRYTMDYEAAVNGRAIPDLDLGVESRLRVTTLLRRGLAFAWAALNLQYRQLPSVTVSAFVSIGPTLLDPDSFTGNVTFCAVRPGDRPYIDPKLLHNEIVAALFTDDCHDALPVGF